VALRARRAGGNGLDAWPGYVDALSTLLMVVMFVLLMVCIVIMVATTFAFPETLKPEAEALVWTDWREPLRGQAGGNGLANYRFAAALVLSVFVVLYLIFR